MKNLPRNKSHIHSFSLIFISFTIFPLKPTDSQESQNIPELPADQLFFPYSVKDL